MTDDYIKEINRQLDLANERIAKIESDLEERTHQYHLAHAKISSREAIIEDLSSELQQAREALENIEKIACFDPRDYQAGVRARKLRAIEEVCEGSDNVSYAEEGE